MRRSFWGVLVLVVALAGLTGSMAQATHAAGLPDTVVITMQYGAALHQSPSSDSSIALIASCGEYLTVVDARQGWFQVYTRGLYFWVGGARVADASVVASPDCSNAITYQVDDLVSTYVPSGCLSQRSSPSRSASFSHCVENGTVYQLKSGPIAVSGEDWFQVWSADNGYGWMLAQYLIGLPHT